MRRLRNWTTALLLVGFAMLATGCDRTTGALLVGGTIIGTALVLDAIDDDHHHHRHHGHHGHGYHHSTHHDYDYGYSHGGDHYGGGYDYCD